MKTWYCKIGEVDADRVQGLTAAEWRKLSIDLVWFLIVISMFMTVISFLIGFSVAGGWN